MKTAEQKTDVDGMWETRRWMEKLIPINNFYERTPKKREFTHTKKVLDKVK